MDEEFEELFKDKILSGEVDIDSLKDWFYREKLTTTFEHEVYVEPHKEFLTKTIDFLPWGMSARMLVESWTGVTLNGQHLTTEEKHRYREIAINSAIIETLMFGAFGGFSGLKSLGQMSAKEIAKMGLTDTRNRLIVGWSGEIISETLTGAELDPRLVAAIRLGGTAYLGYKLNKIGKHDVKTDIEGTGNVTVEFNGKTVTMDDTTFDLNYVDPKTGLTNQERVLQDLAPIGYDGKPVNIHHIDQTNNGPVMEIQATEHQRRYKELHTNTGQLPSQINRSEFNKWRKAYWKWRFENIE